jgi:hypothetical protein
MILTLAFVLTFSATACSRGGFTEAGHTSLPTKTPAEITQTPADFMQSPSDGETDDECTDNISADNGDMTGPDTDADIELGLKLAGLWHGSPVVGAGFSERLLLDKEYSFVWLASQMDGMQRVRARSGYWQITGGKLELYATEEIRWEGGYFVPAYASWGTDEVIEDAITVVDSLTEPLLLVYDVSEITVDMEVMKRTVTIGEKIYWELGHPADQSEVCEDFEALKAESGVSSLADMVRSGYGIFSGVVCEGNYYHDGLDEWFVYYYADVGAAEHETLKNGMDDYYDIGESIETEVQLYSSDKSIVLEMYTGREITFGGEWFAAHTVHHRRSIVFEVKYIYSAE